MPFPETRHTLIQRLAQGGETADWRDFLNDYWGPLVRFSRRRGGLSESDAEDIAAQTLEAVIRNKLLGRWSANQSAKLRTLICAVARNVLSNRARINSGRERIHRERAAELDRYLTGDAFTGAVEPEERGDAFYTAWAEDLVQSAVESLLVEYTQEGKGDHFRALYGKICDEMTSPEIAESLRMKVTSVDSCYRHARLRLEEKLREALRSHVLRYSPFESAETEFTREWAQLGEYLASSGGLEAAVRDSYQSLSPDHRSRWMAKVVLEEVRKV